MPAALTLIAMSILYAVLGSVSHEVASVLAGPFVVLVLLWPLLARRSPPSHGRREADA